MGEETVFNYNNQPKLLQYDFSSDSVNQIKNLSFGENWPVVYILNNQNVAYVGETNNISRRLEEHLQNPEKQGFETISFIYDKQFNKSVTLDLEATLISMMQADQKFLIYNRNAGQDLDNNYYLKQNYHHDSFPKIWELLFRNNLADSKYEDIQNSDLYKFSPFKQLNQEQYTLAQEIITALDRSIVQNQEKTFIVSGSPGTGKTILAVYLINRLCHLLKSPLENNLFSVLSQNVGMTSSQSSSAIGSALTAEKLQNNKSREFLLAYSFNQSLSMFDPIFLDSHLKMAIGDRDFKIGLVIPQESVRSSLQKVFSSIPGLSVDLILKPSDVKDQFYDLLVVDEAHRLAQRKNLPSYVKFDEVSEALGIEKYEATQLDWILKQSRYQIFFYDPGQSVKGGDITHQQFKEKINLRNPEYLKLSSQMRCIGGNDYIDYIESIFTNNPPETRIAFGPEYDLKLYDHFDDLYANLKQKEQEQQLCRLVSGYGFRWKTKGLSQKQIYDEQGNIQKPDFTIDSIPLVWNSCKADWVNRNHSVHLQEVGTVDTIQGFDLNYAGVIIGPEVYYNEEEKRIDVHKDLFFDKKAKEKKTDDEIREMVLNRYRVLLTRGIKGTYIYAADPKLRAYLKQYF